MFFNIVYSLLRFLFFFLYRVKVKGRENLPESGGMLVCANHSCLKDPVFVAVAIGYGRSYTFMARSELFQIPVFGFIIKKLGAFPVKRGSADVISIKTALRALKSGKTLVVFPEGSRWSDEAKAGAGMLAVRGGAPVVPVYIGGSKRLFTKVTVTIGKPYMPETAGKPVYKEVANHIMLKVRSLAEEAYV